MNVEHGRLRVVMVQYERDRVHVVALDVEQPPALHGEARANEAMR
jgi:hypothetical protein